MSQEQAEVKPFSRRLDVELSRQLRVCLGHSMSVMCYNVVTAHEPAITSRLLVTGKAAGPSRTIHGKIKTPRSSRRALLPLTVSQVVGTSPRVPRSLAMAREMSTRDAQPSVHENKLCPMRGEP